jgi:ABC-2 type transport system permease protein
MKFNLKLLKYELTGLISNILTLVFGLALPIALALLFSFVFRGEGDEVARHVSTHLFILMSLIVPLSIMLISYSESYARELESGVIQRMKLFGYSERTQLLAKLLANFLFLLATLAIYFLVVASVLNIAAPSITALLVYSAFLFSYSAILLILGHAIAALCGRSGPTQGITMTVYFAFMILGGIMGVNPGDFPGPIRWISQLLPLYYIGFQSDGSYAFLNFWMGGSYNYFLQMFLSMLGFALFSVGLLLLSIYLNKKGKRRSADPKPVYDE